MHSIFKAAILLFIFNSSKVTAQDFPTICSVAKSHAFRSCLELSVTSDVCPGTPPRPCARVTYYLPYFYTEVVSNPKETYFSSLPGAKTQLEQIKNPLPFGTDEDNGSYSYHAHVTSVPFTQWALSSLPCGGAPVDRYCFGAMSEHLGANWSTGKPDMQQPLFLAWAAAPKACLIKGAAMSVAGTPPTPGGPDMNMCSTDRSWMSYYPPTAHPACTGWGVFYPRYGTVTNSDQTTASLMIASRMRSLANQVFNSIPSEGIEKWQMIYPQTSSCFRHGQNVSILRSKNVNEIGRFTSGDFKNYLYVTYRRISCKVDWPTVPVMNAGLEVAINVCRGSK